MIDTTFPEVIFGNLAEALVLKTCCIVKNRFISIDSLIQNLENASFRNVQYVIRPDCNMFRSDAFKDIGIFLNPDMKDMTSLQTLLEDNEEMEILRAAMKQEKKNGTYEKFQEEFFPKKRKFGTHFTLYAQVLKTFVTKN